MMKAQKLVVAWRVMLKTVDGKLVVIAGASRSGKTAYTVQQIAKEPRILAYDPEDQYSQLKGFKRVTSQKELFRLVKAGGDVKIAYVVEAKLKENFNFFCGCAFYWALNHGRCVVVGEELADVTNAGKAPDKWGTLLRRGLKRGVDIYAISQRWAEADKTAIGNASEFVCFRMNGDDIPYMSRKTRIPVDDLEGLESLEFIKYVSASKEKTKGILRF